MLLMMKLNVVLTWEREMSERKCLHPEIHMVVVDERLCHCECAHCGILMMRVLKSFDDTLYTFVPAHQCENCDEFYSTEPVPFPDPDSKWAKSTFCCYECAQDAYESAIVGAQDDARQYECWGNDYDSWHR